MNASVNVNGNTVGEIGKGFLILLGVAQGDTEEDARNLASKISKLRVFEDENEKMNLSITDVNGEALVVSQFTLFADCKKGNRPSFTSSASPDIANKLYEYFSHLLLENGIGNVENGVFGADMKVNLLNDGPVTIILDSEIWRK